MVLGNHRLRERGPRTRGRRRRGAGARRGVCGSVRATTSSPATPSRGQAVSRYFFHLTNGTMVGDMVEDVDGESFDLVAEARAHAVRVAQELAQHSSPWRQVGIGRGRERRCRVQDAGLAQRLNELLWRRRDAARAHRQCRGPFPFPRVTGAAFESILFTRAVRRAGIGCARSYSSLSPRPINAWICCQWAAFVADNRLPGLRMGWSQAV
jgi:Domain of unknown function (DUF6894)